ncbi:ABC transporter permease [Paenibacillus camelliae]|uniref:ABC transporter permease n=1 Tax=Paenibacillus camelliae TaxID=512410 RepID=UPI00203FFBF9|nr:ABC transporter permease [Paenibacillus camelliae]MCM3631948.1 ABC transporter permease [Paenibacillus camelliae]
MSKLQPLQSVKQFFMNPVIDKEYRLRMRTSRSMWTLLAYLIAMGLFSGVIFSIVGIDMRNSIYSSGFTGIAFIVLSFAQLGLIAFMSPGLTAGVISSEREKQTLNLLLTTQQTSFTIIVSKLIASISFMLLIVFSTLPLYGIVFLYGGISPGQLLSVFAFFIFNMLVFGAFGVLFSTIFKRTMIAVIVTYGVVLFMFVGTGIIYLLFSFGYNSYGFGGNNPANDSWILHFLAINPGFALYSVLDGGDWYMSLARSSRASKTFFDHVPFWLEYVIFYTAILVLAIYGAIRNLRPVSRKKQGV